MSWIGQWVQEKAAEYLKAGVQAGGTLAGNAVGGVGSLVEDSGRSLGQGVTGGINSVGDYINGYGANIKSSLSADGPVHTTTRKPSQGPAAPVQKRKSEPVSKSVSRPLSSTTHTAVSAASRSSRPPNGSGTSSPRNAFSASATKRSAAPKASPAIKRRGTSVTQQSRSPVSTMQSERTPGGKVKISAASKPRRLSTADSQVQSFGDKPRSRSSTTRSSLPNTQSRTRPAGKVVVSPESRPKHVKA